MKKGKGETHLFVPFKTYLLRYTAEEDLSPVRKRELRRQWKQAYNRWYEKHWRRDKKLTVRLTQKEYNLLRQAVEEKDELEGTVTKKLESRKGYRPKIGSFLRDIGLAYLESRKVAIDIQEVRSMEQTIRGVANNINQVVLRIHAMAKYKTMSGELDEAVSFTYLKEEYRKLVQKVMVLEEALKTMKET